MTMRYVGAMARWLRLRAVLCSSSTDDQAEEATNMPPSYELKPVQDGLGFFYGTLTLARSWAASVDREEAVRAMRDWVEL